VGGAAILAWAIAGVVVAVLALVHAELGAMYPVAGGTARFPHMAFGSVAGLGFGFFAYVQAVTIAPIESFAFMQYGSYFWHGIYNAKTGNVTTAGFILTIVLMAVMVSVNFLAMRLFSRVNSAITWWKVAIPILAIIVLFFKFKGGNFTAGGAGFMPGGLKALFGAIPGAGIVFAYSGFEQADQLAGEIKDPVHPAGLRQDQRQRHSVGQPDHRVHHRAVLPAAVPELALPGRPDHRRERADVRGRTAVDGRVPPAGAGRNAAVPDAGRRVPVPGRVLRGRPAHLLVGFRGGLEARHRAGHRLRHPRYHDVARPAAAEAELAGGPVDPGVADRPGHHLLAGRVQRADLQDAAAAD
jgi:hypothetical protein